MNKVLCLILAVFLSIITLHPGRTDENGGHYDTNSGEYHYHHGYPAHLHTNGVCPYDFDDRTGEDSGNSSENGSISRSSPIQSKGNKHSIWEILETVFLVFVGIYSVYRIVWFFFVQPRLEEKKQNKIHRSRQKQAQSSATKFQKTDSGTATDFSCNDGDSRKESYNIRLHKLCSLHSGDCIQPCENTD